MKSIRILDCTLRDGGFVNNWNFGFGSMKSIISRLDKACIDIIEIGFIDDRHPYNQDRSMLPDTDSFNPLIDGLDIQHAMIVGMIDFGTCDISRISPRERSCMDGIRVIFKKKDQDAAIEYLRQLKEKGYKIFANPVSITGYSDDEIRCLAEKINNIEPYAVSVVDTYGLMHNEDLLHYFHLFHESLNNDITIGYHSHNNFQMAYANSIALSKIDIDRDLVLDSSLYGMGKGAGNANTELLAMYFNENFHKRYEIDQLLEAIDVDIMKEFAKSPWGYSLKYYIAALNDCHPDYVKYLLGKKTLAVKSVNEILSALPATSKLSFKKELIEELYAKYQNASCNDESSYAQLLQNLQGKTVLLLGPGTSIIEDSEKISLFIRDNKPVIMSINFVHDLFDIDYVFMGNSKRYSQFFHKIYGQKKNCKVICTSNIAKSTKRIDYVFNYSSLTMETETIRDNPLLMLLKILQKCSVNNVVLAGFDGYSGTNAANYYGDYIPLLYCDDDVTKRNEAISESIRDLAKSMPITSITKTMYFKP